jgi:uncharacterized protein (DUF952 family)
LVPTVHGAFTRATNDPIDRDPALPMTNVIYKICERRVWEEAQFTGMFEGSSADLRDGFIHLSAADQVRDTAAKHFAGVPDLLLVAVDPDALGDRLKWEISRGGDLFPHLYGALPVAAVLWAKPLPLAPDGRHIFPEQME